MRFAFMPTPLFLAGRSARRVRKRGDTRRRSARFERRRDSSRRRLPSCPSERLGGSNRATTCRSTGHSRSSRALTRWAVDEYLAELAWRSFGVAPVNVSSEITAPREGRNKFRPSDEAPSARSRGVPYRAHEWLRTRPSRPGSVPRRPAGIQSPCRLGAGRRPRGRSAVGTYS